MIFFKTSLRLILLLLVTAIFIPACTEQKPITPNTPLTVAETFWTAVLKGDTETARQFLTPQSSPGFKFILQDPKDFVELGQQSITTTQAQIVTQLTRHRGDQTEETALRTILVNENGQWLVDFDKTQASMLGTDLQSVLEQLSTTMSETLDKGVKIMGESVKDELQKMEHSLQEGIDEMNKELERQKKNQQAPVTTTL